MRAKTKRNWKQIVKIAFVFLLICSVLFQPLQLVKTQAATAHMKNLGVNFDLKNNKTLTYKSYYVELGLKSQKVKMTNYKVQDAKKKGYNKLTFTVDFDRSLKVTDEEIRTMILDGDLGCGIGGGYRVTAVDYKTGENLELKNSHKVKVTVGDWKTGKEHVYTTKDGYTLTVSDQKVNVCIIYPKTYKDLCIGVGGTSGVFEELGYDRGEAPFGKNHDGYGKDYMYSKKVKALSHFMRVK